MKRIVLYDASAIDRPTREDLHRLARMRLAARRGGCDLVLTGVGQRLRLLLAVTGLDEVFTVSELCDAGEFADIAESSECLGNSELSAVSADVEAVEAVEDTDVPEPDG